MEKAAAVFLQFSPENFGNSLQAPELSILPKQSLYSFQHLPGVHWAHRHYRLLSEKEREIITTIVIITFPEVHEHCCGCYCHWGMSSA